MGEYDEDYASIEFLRATLVDLSRCVSNGVYTFEELDEHLSWIMFVGDIHLFSLRNSRAFYFVSSETARQLGYEDVREVYDAGSFAIMNRHYKKLECIYWVRHLLRLPHYEHIEVIDYIARTKVMQPRGRLGFEDRRYLACNLKDIGRHSIICVSFNTANLARDACCFRTATHVDPTIRALTPAVYELASGARRLEVFVRRSRKQAPRRIAEAMGISTASVHEHLTAIYRILGFEQNKLASMISFAQRSGLKDGLWPHDPPFFGVFSEDPAVTPSQSDAHR